MAMPRFRSLRTEDRAGSKSRILIEGTAHQATPERYAGAVFHVGKPDFQQNLWLFLGDGHTQ
jgi:hypothetical protein